MNECKGLIGKAKGHNFQSFLIMGGVKLPNGICIESKADGEGALNLLDSYRDKYCIICTRCGVKLDDLD